MQATRTNGFVDAKTGFVDRRAFTSDDVYRRELETIFDKGWIYLAHDTEIPEAGDFVTRQLGSAPVIVVRLPDGEIGAFLNSCRHRGVKLCRGEGGQAANFVCPYHGWSYRTDGSLITTTFDRHFPEGTDFSTLDLVKVPRLGLRHGMIFGSWNEDVIALADYLGDIDWYLKAFFARTPGGVEVLAPAQRWKVRANWKMGALNFIGDSQHIRTTHIGPITLDHTRSSREGFTNSGQDSFQVVTEEGHGCTLTYLAPGMPEANYQTHNADLRPLYEQTLADDQLGMLHHLRVCVGNVFPNLSFIESQSARGQKALIVRLWQPTGGTSMEVLSWVFAEKEASDDYKAKVLREGFHNFGSAGVFEQDDMEIWISATDASDNPIAERYPFSFHTCLPYLDSPVADYPWPGKAFRPQDTEVAQFEFMRSWERRLMSNSAAANGGA